ncbi:MAG: sulfate adenylyltransferase subunit CysN [Alphaproteobacteria bacterium]
MEYRSEEISTDIEGYLTRHQNKDMLRFITCGSVDDGKSTLIGRLLYESKMIFEDQLAALETDSKKHGTQGEQIDFALLVDGLAAEREQGITIDVAYRFFSTDTRKFIVADTPGHEQYTRNMATGASTADLAVVLIDARRGVLTQTRRHSFITSMLGVKHVVVCINKMDLVDYSQHVFNEIDEDYRTFAKDMEFESITVIPVSALAGDMVIDRGKNMPWYQGPALLEYLESVAVDADDQSKPFRMSVQWVNRPNLDFRGFSGRISSGVVRPGDALKALPSAKQSTVSRIVTMDGDLEEAVAGQSVTITLDNEIDVSRGDMLAAADLPCEVSDQFRARILWMSEEEMLPGRPYMMKTQGRTVTAMLAKPRYKVNVNTMEELAADTLELNEIGNCNLSLDRAIPFDGYRDNRETGSFILIDRLTNNTVGMGLIRFALRRASNIHLQAITVEKQARATAKSQKPAVLWFTGLSGSGKSTIANIVEQKLYLMGRHTTLLDGDNVRHGLNRDLGFTDADRVENIRRVGEVAKLMVDSGLLVLVSFISPFRSERQLARSLVEQNEFVEVFVDTPLDVAEQRDVKGLYKKARAGEIKNFTGIDSPYEEPLAAEVRVDTTKATAEEAADQIIAYLQEKGYLS